MWCVRPKTREEAQVVGKWFDENYNSTPEDKFYQSSEEINLYYVFGYEKGNVYHHKPKGSKIYTYKEFVSEFIDKINEPQYEIY